MKRLFLSDIHVGDFASHYHKVIKLIEKESPDELYLVGDIFDLWKDKLNTIQAKHAEIFTSLYQLSLKSKIIFIIGNHDEGLNTEDNYFKKFVFVDSYEINIGDKKAKIVHGHEYDDFVMKFYLFARFCNFIHKIFLRFFHIDLRYKFSLSSKKGSKKYEQIIEEVKKKAINDNKDYDILIMGHTHAPEQVKIDDMEYINLGDWFEDFTYAIEQGGKICLTKIKNRC